MEPLVFNTGRSSNTSYILSCLVLETASRAVERLLCRMSPDAHRMRGAAPHVAQRRQVLRVAATIHPAAASSAESGEQRCFPSEQRGKGAGLRLAEQPTGGRDTVSSTSQQ